MRNHKVLLCLMLYAAVLHAACLTVDPHDVGTSVREPNGLDQAGDVGDVGGVAYDSRRVVSRQKRSNLFFRIMAVLAELPEKIRNLTKLDFLHMAKRSLQKCVENVDVGMTKDAIIMMTATTIGPSQFDLVVQKEEHFRESLLLGTDSDPIPVGMIKSILTVAGRIPTVYTSDQKQKANIAKYLRHGIWDVNNKRLQDKLLKSLGNYAQRIRHILLSLTWYKRHKALYEIGIINDLYNEARKRDEPLLKSFCDRVPLDELEIIREQLLEIQAEKEKMSIHRHV